MKREINNINSKKETAKVITPVLTGCFKQNMKNSTEWRKMLKNANISPVCKKKDRHDTSNYRPVRTLPLLSKPFESILYEQIETHTKDILSKCKGEF